MPDNAMEKADAGPQPILAGTFAIYDDGDGGFVIVGETEGGIVRKHITKRIVSLMRPVMGRMGEIIP